MTLPTDKALVLEKQFRFQWEPAQNTHVLLYPEGLIKLPGSAGEIMQRIDGKASAEDIVRSLEQAFPGADLQQDVIDFLEVAHDKGWIRVA
ncbi:MAG: pyrroloquinoline quinone biosynthesis peptide chaperone PqqD [Pseudohongiellaceae bacterium]